MKHPLIFRWLELAKNTNNCLCVGLDPDITKLPDGYSNSLTGLTHFLQDIVDLTYENCIAYKPNIAFFEAYGLEGLNMLETIVKHINHRVPVILDAKRGDIGNTAAKQARFIFDYFGADATTLHPYMGLDSLEPFFSYSSKFNFLLGLTSNPGAADFELLRLSTNERLADYIIKQAAIWNQTYQNIGVVVGATDNKLAQVRQHSADLLFLIPGVGAQGGSYQYAFSEGKNESGLALISVSRSILYAAREKTNMRESILKILTTFC